MGQVFAQTLNLPNGTQVIGPTGLSWATSLGEVVFRALPFVFAATGFGFLLMMVFAGFDFLTSAGDPKKMEGGKSRMTNAVIGFLVIFTAYWVVQIVGRIFGIEEIQGIFQ